MIEIKLNNNDDFLKIKETLTRIGIPQLNNRTLHQSCHILHRNGRYYISHFKELLAKDKTPNMDEEDYERLYVISKLLNDWNLCELIDDVPKVNNKINLHIIPFKEKYSWKLKQKFNLGGE